MGPFYVCELVHFIKQRWPKVPLVSVNVIISLTLCVWDVALEVSTSKNPDVLLVHILLQERELTTGLAKLSGVRPPVLVEWDTWKMLTVDLRMVSVKVLHQRLDKLKYKLKRQPRIDYFGLSFQCIIWNLSLCESLHFVFF